MYMLDLLREEGLKIPGDFSIIGADDHPRSATLPIPLSTVRVPHREVGLRGAQLLEDIMEGKIDQPQVVVIPPTTFSSRTSTEIIEIHDADVYAVMRFIRRNAGESYAVADAISVSDLGRRSLEQNFRTILGHSILEEIHRARISRAQHLLSETSDSIAYVAMQCGFKDASHFSLFFKKIVKVTPRVWRSNAQRLRSVPR